MDFQDDAVSPFEETIEDDDGGMSPDGGDNRTFLLVAGGLGLLILLTLACMAIFLLRGQSSGGQGQRAEVATINAQNTQVAQALAQTQLAQAWTPTFTPTSPPATPTATPTAVVAMPTSTFTPAPPTDTPTPDARQATVEALQTIQAMTLTPETGGAAAGTGTPSATELPQTGFADEVGLPGLAIGAAALLLVIFMARRLRNAA